MGNLLAFVTSQPLNPSQILVRLLVASLLGVALAWIYKLTHRGVSYSQSFVIALVLVTLTTATAIMAIGQNLAVAAGLIGAFSVIRFRTAVKDARDIAFIFFGLVEGLVVGTGNLSMSLLAFLVYGLIVIFLTRGQFGKFSPFEYLLSFVTPVKTKDKADYFKIFHQYLADQVLISFRPAAKDTEVIASYSIRLKHPHLVKDFIRSLKKTGVTHIELISSQADIDY